MTGERLAWFRVASHLHLPVSELAERITHSEFLEWLSFLVWENEQHGKSDYYLAQIAAEVVRTRVKDPRTVKTKDFLLQSKKSQEPAAKAASSKAIWMEALDLKNN